MLSQNSENELKQSLLGRPLAGLVTLLAVVLLLVAAAAPLAAQAPTHKQTDKLVTRAHYVIGSLKTARLQIKTTLDEYNAIIDGKAPDNRAAYKKLNKDIGRSEKRAALPDGLALSREVVRFHRKLPLYETTPLVEAKSVAQQLGLATVLVKDESRRFGMPSFKLLGASWATYQALRNVIGKDFAPWTEIEELRQQCPP